MKLRRRCMQTLRVSVKQLRKKLCELGARILHAQPCKPRDMALVILSMGSAMDVPRGGSGRDAEDPKKNPSRRLERDIETGRPRSIREAMLAEARDRALRSESVRKDLALNLPPRLELPDGEERAYGTAKNFRLRTCYQESELMQKCVKAPPNHTVFDTGEEQRPVPYLRQSSLAESPERSRTAATNSILKIFRKFPSSGGASSSKKVALSSYAESGSTLSNITMLPCDTDETQRRQWQQQREHWRQRHVEYKEQRQQQVEQREHREQQKRV